MNGCTRLLCGALLIVLAGCDEDPPPAAKAPAPPVLGEAYDAESCGTIVGRILWDGEVPRVPPYRAPVAPNGPAALGPRHEWPNPNVPKIDPNELTVEGAVVFLRGVDPKRSRPWDLPPARLEMDAYDYHVRQGDMESRTGFVQLNTAVEMVSRQSILHSVRARGDAFFTLAVPDPDRPVTHVFDRPGVVELSSAAGYYWAQAHLFVTEHPYYARTNACGEFQLPHVPPGNYELVCWLPNWHEQERERDADTWQVSRVNFRPPYQTVLKVQVDPHSTTQATFPWPAAQMNR